MSRYLIITYYYPPMISARAFRWGAIARQWVAQGHQVDVVCAWLPGLPEYETLDGVQVYRVNAKWQEKLRAQFIKPTSSSALKVASPTRANPLKRLVKAPLRWVYTHVYTRLYWPDGAFLWYFAARRQARALLRQNAYDVLISVSLYFTAHLVGESAYHAAPHLVWLADMGDPFATMEDEQINNPLYKRLNLHVERRVLRKVDAISVTTPGTVDLYARSMADVASKMTVIPPLLSAPMQQMPSPRADDKIRLVFTGVLYAKIRRPDFLLRVFHALQQTPLGDRLELHFYGYATQVEDAFAPYQDDIGRSIFLHGTVSREAAAQAVADADMLVNIGNTTAYQLPSKVVEYVSTGKRILNIALIDHDSSAAFFASYPLAITLNQAMPVEEAAQHLYTFLTTQPAQLPPQALEAHVAAYLPEKIAESYRMLIESSRRAKDKT